MPPAPISGAELDSGERLGGELPPGTISGAGLLPGLRPPPHGRSMCPWVLRFCWDQGGEKGPGHQASRAPGKGAIEPECQNCWCAVCSGLEQTLHLPQARVHRLHRALPWASGTAPSRQAGEPWGPLSVLGGKAKTWLL